VKTRLCGQCATRYAVNLTRCPECDTHAYTGRESERETGTGNCAANGCPLPGTVSDGTNGSGTWTCSVHRHADSATWTESTARIRTHGWLWKACQAIRQEGPSVDLAHRVSGVCNTREFEALAWDETAETLGQWAYRFQMGYLAFATTGKCASQPKVRDTQALGGNAAHWMGQMAS